MKKFLAALLGVTMICSSCAILPLNEKKTEAAIMSDWAEETIEKAKKMKLIDCEYEYRSEITREDFCELIYKFWENHKINDGDVVVKRFSDTDNSHINLLAMLGIVEGKTETEFAPNDLLTREEAATIIFRLIDTLYPNWVAHELWYEFSDNDEVSDWAMDDIQWLCNMGIMQGMGDGRFAPKENLTVEQAIGMITRVKEKFFEKTEIDFSQLTFADKIDVQMPEDENYVFSPLSIKTALALAANGAEGETKDEILNVLGIEDLEEFNKSLKETLERYSKSKAVKVNVANSLWINEELSNGDFGKDFKAAAEEYYDAEVNKFDNKNAAKKINSWVSKKTNGKITQIVEDGNDLLTLIINAVYFKGAWQNEFDARATKKDEFVNFDGEKVQTDFLNNTAYYEYAQTQSAEILKLDYETYVEDFDEEESYIEQNLDVSMYLLAADEDVNVAEEIEAAISDGMFECKYITLSMPKFKFDYDENLDEILQSIGMKEAFTEDARFEKIMDDGNMKIDKVLHKAYIAVDEKGCEAAAVTSVERCGSALAGEPVKVKFDKPFYFLIRDNLTGEIFFMGRVALINE